MDPYRSSPTHEIPALLNIMTRGGTEDWRALYQRMKSDRSLAEKCAQALLTCDPDLTHNGEIWQEIIEQLHPTVTVNLNQTKAYAI